MLTFRWIKISPFLILMLQFTVFSAAETKHVSYLTVRVGDEVTLPCESVNNSRPGCPSWIFRGLTSTDSKQLTSNGQIGEKAKDKSARLSVTADCSLVIKNFTAEDVGLYTCKSEEVQRQDGTVTVDLSVINMTKQRNNDKVILTCSVLEYDQCTHTAEWLYEGKQKTSSDMMMSPRVCSAATVTFTTSQFNQKSNFYQSLMCKVTNMVTKKEQLFPFKYETSDEETVFSAAETTKHEFFFTLRVGTEVTLPCESVNNSRPGCPSWIFHGLTSTDTKQLTSNGQIGEKAKNKSARLSVTADCSLVIKNITAEDVGLYTCKSEEVQRQVGTVTVDLSVINMTKQRNNDKVILTCSVLEYDQCTHTAEWLYEGKQKTSSDMMMSPRVCSAATVTFTTSQFNQKSNFYQSLTCKVTNMVTKKEQLFPFKYETSDEETDFPYFLRFIIMSVGLAALLLSAVTVNIWIKTKGNKSHVEDNAVHDDEGTVNCENTGDPSASVRLH